MSAATTNAIYTLATTTSALTSLLGTAPDGQPAFFYGHKLRTPPVMPQVTFREAQLDQISYFWQTTGYVDDQYYDFEVWVADPGSNSIDTIRLQLDALFHKTKLSLASPTHNFNYWCERDGTSHPDNYDHVVKAFFGLYRFRFVVGQG